ncbi:ATP-binding protein [Streptomyces tropicalis]|uniref:ATP-binding protein n=1 Tax=Streptomyces tropicalis TaxID=3034234 RepID=A0ABT6AA50_9ACTN|nr:ATP-binding protein [Streptomyces tropicalis]MDF3301524.1 ATP-binding protein [Streptomyces tropicalis]
MVIPLSKQAVDDRETDPHAAALRYGATYDTGAARIADARRAVRVLLVHASRTAPTDVTERAEQDAQLVVSELVTNALRHAPGPCGLVLEVSPCRERLSITVWDTSSTLPRFHERDESRVGGHGLYLVRACSRDLTVTSLPGGKRITAEIDLGPAAPSGSGRAAREPGAAQSP